MRVAFRQLLLLAMFAAACAAAPAFADRARSSDPFHAVLRGDLRAISQIFDSADRSGTRRSIAPLVIEGVLPGLGRVRGTLDERKDKNWSSSFVSDAGEVPDPTDVIFLNGAVQAARPGFGSRKKLAGAVISSGSGYRLILHFKSARSRSRSAESFFKLEGVVPASAFRADSAKFSLHHAPQAAAEHGVCLAHAHPQSANAIAGATGGAGVQPQALAASVVLKQATVATESDVEWFLRYGGESNARTAVLINAADTIFTRDVGVTFQLGKQHTWTSAAAQPYQTTSPDALLGTFQDYTNAHGQLGVADLHHLFSGKDFEDNVAGIAYLGVVCRMPTAAYSTTQHVDDTFDHLFVAHELGHNFGADHDVSTQPPSLMYPSVSSSQTSFSPRSKAQISSYLSSNGGCLRKVSSEVTPSPTPTPGGNSSGNGANQERFLMPSVSIKAALGRTGHFVVDGTLSGTLHAQCFVRLTAARAPGFAHPLTLAEFSGDATTFHMESSGVERLTSSTGATKLYVRAEYLCPVDSKRVYSLPVILFPSKVRSASRTTSFRQWINDLLSNSAQSSVVFEGSVN